MKINNYVLRYKDDEDFRILVGLQSGSISCLFFMLLQLYGGIKYQSSWFLSFAVYYAVLTFVKFYLARNYRKKGADGWRCFRLVGLVMVILNFALIVMVSALIADPSIAIHRYSPVIAVITGLWTVVALVLANINVVRLRKKNNAIQLADGFVQLITSAVSVLILQTSIIATISTPQIDEALGVMEQFSSVTGTPKEVYVLFSDTFTALVTSNDITGIIVGVFSCGVTGYMIVKGTTEKRKVSKQVPAKS